jgi:hypothetical protein
MFGLSGNESFVLGVGCLWIYSAAVAALADPTSGSSAFYNWFYKFSKAISGDLAAKFGNYFPTIVVKATTDTTTSVVK